MQSQADPGQLRKVLADVQNMRVYLQRLHAWQTAYGYKGMHPSLRGAVEGAEKSIELLTFMLDATLIGPGERNW